MLKEITDFVRKSAAKIFTWPNRYLSEHRGEGYTAACHYVTPENSLGSSSVAACVLLLSETIAALPLHVHRNLGKSKGCSDGSSHLRSAPLPPERLSDELCIHTAGDDALPIARQLLRSNRTRRHWKSYRALASKSLWRRCRSCRWRGPLPIRLWRAAWRFSFEDVLHFKGLTLNGLVGLSVLGMARQGIGLSVAQELHASSLFRNNARPGLVLTMPGILNPEAREKFNDSFATKFAGALNSGKTVLLEGDMKIEPVGFTSEDSQFLESRQFSVIEIARWFRVPPTMIGDMSRVSYSSSESEMHMFAVHSLVPWCANLEAEISMKLLPDRTQFFVKFDVNFIVRGDQQSRYSSYSQGLVAGFLTVADVREAEGLPFIAGTDKLNRPSNMVPHEGANNAPVLPAA